MDNGGYLRTLKGQWLAQVPTGDGKFRITDGQRDYAANEVGEWLTVSEQDVPEDVKANLGPLRQQQTAPQQPSQPQQPQQPPRAQQVPNQQNTPNHNH